MSSEKITGVCVDIPKLIAKAKEYELLKDINPKVFNMLRELILYHELDGYAQKWISVTDRLPEENKVVLGWDGIHYYEARLMQHEADINLPYTLEFYIQDSQGSCMIEPDLPITHWMLMPEPPKEIK